MGGSRHFLKCLFGSRFSTQRGDGVLPEPLACPGDATMARTRGPKVSTSHTHFLALRPTFQIHFSTSLRDCASRALSDCASRLRFPERAHKLSLQYVSGGGDNVLPPDHAQASPETPRTHVPPLARRGTDSAPFKPEASRELNFYAPSRKTAWRRYICSHRNKIENDTISRRKNLTYRYWNSHGYQCASSIRIGATDCHGLPEIAS